MQTFGQSSAGAHKSALLRYGFAVGAALASSAITTFIPALRGIPFALSFVAIASTAWFGGFYAGLLAAVLSAALVNFFVFTSRSDSSGSIVQTLVLLGVSVIISAIARQREHKQERLEKVENFFETTLRSIGDAVVATDANGGVTFLNSCAEQLTGWPLPEARGRSLTEVLPLFSELTGEPVENPIAKVLRTGQIVGLANHTSFTSRSGQHVQIEDSAAPIRDRSGLTQGVVLVFRDVSEKYALEKRRAEAESVLRDLVDSISEGFGSLDTGWNYTYVNCQGAALCGYTPEQLIGRNHWEVFPETVGTGFETLFRRVAEQQVAGTITEYYPPLDKWLQMAAYPAQNGITVLFQDVTESVRAAEGMRIAERLATAGRLAAAVSHEINNPLEAVANLLYIAKATSSESNVQETLSEAERQLYRAAHIARQTLTFYKTPSEPTHVNVASAIEDVIKLFKSRMDGRGISLTVNAHEEASVFISYGELIQVIANLLSNAFDAAPAHSEIQLLVQRQNGFVEIQVADAGPGIPPALQQKIFEPFFTTKREVGTGLGLWVIKNIVEKHQGTIAAANVDSGRQGAIFTVRLPVASRQAVSADGGSPSSGAI